MHTLLAVEALSQFASHATAPLLLHEDELSPYDAFASITG